jgi:hypothetical protein
MALREITRDTCQGLREDITTALRDLAQKYGVQVTVGSARFTPANVTFKVELALLRKDASGKANVMTKEATDFQRYALRWHMSPDDLFRKFTYDGFQYTLVGARPRKKQCPIIGASPGGKRMLFSTGHVTANWASPPVGKPELGSAPGPDANGHIHSAKDILPGMGIHIYNKYQFAANGHVNPNRQSQNPPSPGEWNLCAEDGQLLLGCETEQEACAAANKLIDMGVRFTDRGAVVR